MSDLTPKLYLGRLGAARLGTPLLLVVLLATVVLPLPATVLDILFTFNISLALVVLLVVVYTRRPLEFSVFPTVLLIATLLRLALNIASTRIVLLNGHTGTDAAGRVIEAFGAFVVGGSYAVGLVVFSILIIINFVVVTKGAGRISEVSARFTLDAMPGKQMAIDADLSAGLITQEQARERRVEISQEADFYGAMDGASKFVRGDAIAGLLILVINILGGLAIGSLQHGLSVGEALRVYALLTVGDGLVAQIPALLLSTGAAIIVTRVSTTQDVSEQILAQLFGTPKALAVTAAVIGGMGIMPGMPNVAFLLLASATGGAAFMISMRDRRAAAASEEAPAPAEPAGGPELTWDDVTPIDTVGLEVGYRLIPLVDQAQGGELMTRIKGVRKKLTQELGFLIPPVHIRDNLELAPSAYRVTLMGVISGDAEIHPDRDMAINPGHVAQGLDGIAGKDPAFGLDAVWIDGSKREHAQMLGYTVVDPSTVVATHLCEVLQRRAHELLGREEVQKLLDTLARSAPKLVEELVPKALPLGVVVKVLQNLLLDQVSIRDMRTIAEALAEHASRTQDPGVLTAVVRARLGRAIVQDIFGTSQELAVITIDGALDQLLQQALKLADEGEDAAVLEPGLADRLHRALIDATQRQAASGQPAVLLVAPKLRAVLTEFVRQSITRLKVLAFNEIPGDRQIRVVATVGG